jgi:iron-sulfur cluster assembly protein
MAQATPIRPRPSVISLTDAAAERVRHLLSKQEQDAVGLRIGVKNGGCAGMEYTMEWAKELKPFDEVVEQKGVKLLIDAKAIMFLLGTEMDYQQGTLKSGFTFTNPNQVGSCGCGESVQLKPAGVTG